MNAGLLEFLQARLDEDEGIARSAAQEGSPEWRYLRIPGEPDDYTLDFNDDRVIIADWSDEADTRPGEVEHIARWDPARVLADVASKRQLVQMHRQEPEGGYSFSPGSCPECSCAGALAATECFTIVEFPCATLRLLALPYSWHPEYLPEWAPEVPR